jgi:hypothetical protein
LPLILIWVKHQNGVGRPNIVAATADTPVEQGSPKQGFTSTIPWAKK